MTIRTTLIAILLAFGVAGDGLFAQEEESDSELLTIGSQAPALDIEHWVQDGEGNFEHVTKFEDGKVYMIEFWATWCGPCIASMPHISEMQQKYAEQGFQVVSVSDEDLETVEEFLEKDVRGKDDMTYQELTKTYCLTTDPDASVQTAYMRAAGQNGIPTAFLVGKTGRIEWIGHPMDNLEDVIEQVIGDEWDREVFAVSFKAKQKVDALMARLGRKMQQGKTDEVIEELGEAIEEIQDEELVTRLTGIRAQVMISSGADGTADALSDFTEICEDANQLNNLAWAIVESIEGEGEAGEGLIEAAVAATHKAMELEPDGGHIIDTLAHLEHIQGNLDQAIALTEKAVKLSGDQFPEIADFLKELKEEKENGGKESDDKDDDDKDDDDKDDGDKDDDDDGK